MLILTTADTHLNVTAQPRSARLLKGREADASGRRQGGGCFRRGRPEEVPGIPGGRVGVGVGGHPGQHSYYDL